MSQPDVRRYFKHGTLPQLRLFEAIARLGTFARAAQELHMAQPTASLQIKKLTATVGVPLFEQVGKRVYLTEAGRRLQESCGTSWACSASSKTRSLTCERSTPGACAPPSARRECPSRHAFLVRSSAHPGVETSMQAHNRRALVDRLARNEDDLYLFTDPPDTEGVLTQEILSTHSSCWRGTTIRSPARAAYRSAGSRRSRF